MQSISAIVVHLILLHLEGAYLCRAVATTPSVSRRAMNAVFRDNSRAVEDTSAIIVTETQASR